MTATDLWDRERGFWLDGPAFYADHMLPGAQMTFPDPVGILTGTAILDGLRGAPRWRTVTMQDTTALQVGDTCALAYRATATRDGAASYTALCSSTYVLHDRRWLLMSHQQTPVG